MSAESTSQPLDGIGSVAEAFRGAMVDSMGDPSTPPNVVKALLVDHFGGADPSTYDTVSDAYPRHLHLNLQVALDDFLAEPGRKHRILGVHAPTHRGEPGEVSLSLLLGDSTLAWAPVEFMPAEYDIIPSSCESTLACISQGLILIEDAEGPAVIFVRGEIGGIYDRHIMVDVMTDSTERSTGILEGLRERGVRLSPYRGQVIEIAFELNANNYRQVTFIERPEHQEADQVVLPKGLLEEIEEHTVHVLKARDTLLAGGRHLKRGLLLHGRPGTGKTHTIRYLISQMPEATVVIMSGARMAKDPLGRQPLELIRKMVDLIVPAVIVFDDVDFIAEDRSLPGMTDTREELYLLLELLDGVEEDADLLFILTTNRPNMLEPAVAARPGRIDQAIEVPLPDADCRQRLFELYSRDLQIVATEEEIADFVERTDGTTASFIREAVRRAATLSALADGAGADEQITVTGSGLAAALDELIDPDKPLTALLLGAEPEHAQVMLAQITASA